MKCGIEFCFFLVCVRHRTESLRQARLGGTDEVFARRIAAKAAAPGSILVLLDKVDDQLAELLWLFQVHKMAHAG